LKRFVNRNGKLLPMDAPSSQQAGQAASQQYEGKPENALALTIFRS
jgi:hypothetical protein